MTSFIVFIVHNSETVYEPQSMEVTSFKILFSLSTRIFQIARLENGDAKPPLIICRHFD